MTVCFFGHFASASPALLLLQGSDFFDSWSSSGPSRRNSGYLPRAGSSGQHLPPPPPPAAPASHGPSPAASGSLDPTPAKQAVMQPQQQQSRAPYNPLAAIMPLPSLASSDGGVALSDDDFPPLGRPSAAPSMRSVPSTRSLASVVAAAGEGAGGKLLPPAVAAARAEEQGHSSGGPSTPSRASGGGAAGTAAIMGSPAVSDVGRPTRASSAPPGARSADAAAVAAAASCAAAAAAPLARSASTGSLSNSQDGGAGSEGSPATAPAGDQGSYPASVDGSGYQAGGSSSGYETAEEEAARGAADNAAPAGEPILSVVAAPEQPASAVAPAAAKAAPSAPVSFMAPTSPRAKPEPPVAVTFNASGSEGLSPQGSVDMDAAISRAAPACPPGYEKAHAYPVAAPQQEQEQACEAASPPASSTDSPPGLTSRPARPDSAVSTAPAPAPLPSVAVAVAASAAAAAAPVPAAPVPPPVMPAMFGVASVHSFRCPLSKVSWQRCRSPTTVLWTTAVWLVGHKACGSVWQAGNLFWRLREDLLWQQWGHHLVWLADLL